MGNREYVKKKWGMAVGKVSFSYYGTNELMVDLKKKKKTLFKSKCPWIKF